MAYKVLDQNGIGYTGESGVVIIPCGGILDNSLIELGYFRQPSIDYMIETGRLVKAGSKEKVIAPANMKMPEVETKVEKKSTKGKKK